MLASSLVSRSISFVSQQSFSFDRVSLASWTLSHATWLTTRLLRSRCRYKDIRDWMILTYRGNPRVVCHCAVLHAFCSSWIVSERDGVLSLVLECVIWLTSIASDRCFRSFLAAPDVHCLPHRHCSRCERGAEVQLANIPVATALRGSDRQFSCIAAFSASGCHLCVVLPLSLSGSCCCFEHSAPCVY
jgi:hypothetical protein